MVGNLNTGKLYARRRCGGRLFGRRVNCEQVPQLPAWAASWVLDDPRAIRYLLVWKDERDAQIREAVRLARYSEPDGPVKIDWTGWIEVKRTDGSHALIRTVLQPLPRNGAKARFLVCPYCHIPRRALYGWQPGGRFTNSAQTSRWQCRCCAGLRYASEGGALVIRSRGWFARMLDADYGPCRSDRPTPWTPYALSSPERISELG